MSANQSRDFEGSKVEFIFEFDTNASYQAALFKVIDRHKSVILNSTSGVLLWL